MENEFEAQNDFANKQRHQEDQALRWRQINESQARKEEVACQKRAQQEAHMTMETRMRKETEERHLAESHLNEHIQHQRAVLQERQQARVAKEEETRRMTGNLWKQPAFSPGS